MSQVARTPEVPVLVEEPNEAPESALPPRRRRGRTMVAAGLGLVVVAAALGGAEFSKQRPDDDFRATTTTRLAEQSAKIAALEKAIAQSERARKVGVRTAAEAVIAAIDLSEDINETIADPEKTAELKTVNGTVSFADPATSKGLRSYAYAILLSQPPAEKGTKARVGLDADSLNDAWIGLQQTNKDGAVGIDPVAYDADTMKFSPMAGATQLSTLQTVRAFTMARGDASHPVYQAYAIDKVTGDFVREGDQYVRPGVGVLVN